MFSYERLDVYKKAVQANQDVYRLLKQNQSIPFYAKNQFGRASLSVMLNIAEGTAKLSVKDRRNFYITARGSAFECSAIVCFLNREGEINDDLKDQLYSSFEEISRMLFGMVRALTLKEGDK
jgi:four helix bundle protein